MRAHRRLVLGALAVGLLIGVPASATAQPHGQDVVLYVAPVNDWVLDPFRPPQHFAGPGNRGLEYDSPQGRDVNAAAAGTVTFAGSVAGTEVITIQHDDGIRTTYTGLGEIWVSEGLQVFQGEFLGRANGPWHFGARIRDHYLDPQILIDASQIAPEVGPVTARLIPPPG